MDNILKVINKEIGDFAASYQLHHVDLEALKEKKVGSREKFKAILNSYSDSYEGIYKCIGSLPAIAKLILNDGKLPSDLRAFIHSDPKSKILIFEDDEGIVSPALPELYTGCDWHIRNGINHNRWQMQDRNSIQIWDANRKGEETWSETFTLDAIFEELNKLQKTIEALLLALWVFQNNNAFSVKGIFCMPEGYYDESSLKESIEDIAFDMGFLLDGFAIEELKNELYLNIYIPENLDVSQETEIIEGSKPPKFFKVKIEVLEKSAYTEFLSLLGTICRGLFSYSKVLICLNDEKTGHISDVSLSPEELRTLSKCKSPDLEKKFSFLKSYGVRVTYEHLPIRVS